MADWLKKIYQLLNDQSSQKLNVLFAIYLACYCMVLFLLLGTTSELRGDEFHFYPTILQFATKPSLDTLLHYNELTTPLTYILYAGFGKIFGLEVTTLRIFSTIIASITLYSLYQLFKTYLLDKKTPLLLSLLFTLNPYIAGLTTSIYTDMLTILTLCWMFIFYKQNNPVGYVIAAALAIFCRQHSIIVIAAFMATQFLFEYILPQKQPTRFTFASFISLLLPLPLFYFWGGLTPLGKMTTKMNALGISYEFSAISTYVCSIAIYSLPLIFLFRKELLDHKYKYTLTVLSVFYFLFPVRAADCAIADGYTTVGLFHKFLDTTLKTPALVHTILYMLFIAGIYTLFFFTKKTITTFNTIAASAPYTALYCSVIAFLLIMPLSYQIWEKYMLIILPQCFILFTAQNKTY